MYALRVILMFSLQDAEHNGADGLWILDGHLKSTYFPMSAS
jgi:hypothetical protein